VAAALTAAGFSQQNFKQAILYGLPQTAPPQLPSDVVIERVTAASLDVFAHTTAEGFEWPNQWRDAAIDDVRRSFRPEAYHFLARFQGKPAGVGSIGIREGVASLIDGAVVPESRRKGIHLALLHHRLNMAHTLGCTLALGGTVFGSSSFRNQQRAGLRIAYIENGWRKR
jgi:GNAT superfamily N-acetyltransferase